MGTETSDARLWALMRGGDLDAWGCLYDKHSARVYRFCVRLLGSPSEAEDVLSEVFLDAWRSRRAFVVESDTALPILLAVARRTCQKRLRSLRSRWRTQLAATRSLPAVTDVAEVVVDLDEDDRRREWLRQRVSELPTPFRDVFELAVYAELPYGDICGVLGLPLGTVKSRMARARRILMTEALDHGQEVAAPRSSAHVAFQTR